LKILLLGANGQLGISLARDKSLASLGTIVSSSRDGRLADGSAGEVADMAATSTLSSLLDRVQPQVIINAAAYTAVDRAEREEDLAMRVNGEAVEVVGRWAGEHSALVIHYSTDYVFDGAGDTPYPVDAPTSPLGVYGRSKLAGEVALRDSGSHYMIFRTAWVYAAHGHNFLQTMLRLGNERDHLRVVADQRGAPTPTNVITRGTVAALTAWLAADEADRAHLEGTHHLVASGEATWHDFATAIFESALHHRVLSRMPTVEPISTAAFPTPAKRPAYSVLDNQGFQHTFALTLPSWQAGLNDVMRELASKGL
jgi:dTDP-4-dehydrorhamnose reductase